MEEEKTEYCIKTKEQAKDFIRHVLGKWHSFFMCGLDPVYTDTENYEKLGWRTDWDIFRNTTSLLTKLVTKESFTYMDFDFPGMSSSTLVMEPYPNELSPDRLSKKFFYNYYWALLKDEDTSKTLCTLTLKPQVEIHLENESSKEINYLLSVFGSFQCGDFLKKHKCSIEKTVQLGQTLFVSDFWLYIRSNCFYVYELLLDDAYKFWLSKRENDDGSIYTYGYI